MEEKVKPVVNSKNLPANSVKVEPKEDFVKPKVAPKKMSAKMREELLLENFVGLQKAMLNLSIKFEGLANNMSRLLEVFELSARDQLGKSTKEEDKELLNKINSLLDQNKTIAKGLVLIEEKVRDRVPVQTFQQNSFPPANQVQQQQPKKPLPRI